MKTFEEIEEKYLQYAKKWQSKNTKLPIGRVRDDFGGYHLEISEDGLMALIATDRGVETSRQQTEHLEELLYWIFQSEARSRAWQYELKHRHPTNDSRRIVFAKALEEIEKLSPEWRKRLEKEQHEILARNPYRDQD